MNQVLGAQDPEDGLDATEGQVKSIVKAGIIAAKTVTRSALQNAASIAGTFLTTEVAITELPKKEEASPPTPGMGGMGGMM